MIIRIRIVESAARDPGADRPGSRSNPTVYSRTMSADPAPSALDRFLRLFTEVRAGEGFTAVLLASNVFLLLSAYYIIKPVREGLILAVEGGTLLAYVLQSRRYARKSNRRPVWPATSCWYTRP